MATVRIIGYPGTPFGLVCGLRNRTWVASVPASANCVPSMAATSLPANRVTWCAPATAGPLTRVNSSRNGASPHATSLPKGFAGSGNPAGVDPLPALIGERDHTRQLAQMPGRKDPRIVIDGRITPGGSRSGRSVLADRTTQTGATPNSPQDTPT
jgi:hypothetical protein